MKHFLLGVSLLLWTCTTHAQTDQLNQDKYWKFRNNYKEKYMKIGSHKGESLPARALVPNKCYDNTTNPYQSTWTKGMMKWGDGMIRHGHYLTLLATEYRLLKNNNQNEQAQATLNELYYALNAVWRLDDNAEINQDPIFGTTTHLDETLNGFYNREDVIEDFCDYWKNDPMKMECTYGAFYTNTNTAKLNTGGDVVTKGNSYQNTPSMDQTSGLLVGLAMVVKLVDNVTVQPSPSDQAIDVRQRAKEEINWIIRNIAGNNWFMIDVNGWPVNNGGGDACLFAVPLTAANDRFGMGGVFPDIAKRRLEVYKGAQAFATGYGTDGPFTGVMSPYATNIYNQIMAEHPQICDGYSYLRQSPFMNWENCGAVFSVKGDFSIESIWNNTIPNFLANVNADFNDDGYLQTTFGDLGGIHHFDDNPIGNNNNTIIFNLGVLLGTWNSTITSTWGDFTGNRELEIINGVLNSQVIPHNAAFYKDFLDKMTFTGPYNLETGGDVNMKTYHPNGWAGEYRWTSLDEANGEGGEEGIYSALDYMVMYNLYHLAFGASANLAYKETWTCNCASPVSVPVIGTPQEQTAATSLNNELSFLGNCQENVFYPTNNLVGSIFNIEPKFPDYPSWGIYTTKYQTENASVLPGGDILVKTRFVVCNGELKIQNGGRLDIWNKEMIVNTNGIVTNNGIISVGSGTTLTLKTGSKLTLNNGGKLKVEPNGKLIIEPGATLEYYNGAELILADETSEILHGGTIVAKDLCTFSLISQSTTSKKGKFTINSASATFSALQPNTTFKLEGFGFDDPFLTINPNAKLTINDPDITIFRINNCRVEFKDGASMRAEELIYSDNTNYLSTTNNGGITITDVNSFHNCKFNQVPVKAMLSIENKANFMAYDCQFIAPSASLNTSDQALLNVTGMGISISGCSFVANKNYCILSSSLTRASGINNSTFSQNGVASGSTMNCINDASTVELVVTSCTFQKALAAINKSYGKLTLKCNTFSNNDYCNIKAASGCTVDMSTNDLAGYNVLSKSLQNRNIEISNCVLNLKNGYNFIEECTNTIIGTITSSCTPPSCLIDLTNNQWNTGNTIPSLTNFHIQTASNSYAVLPTVSPVAAKATCGYYDGPPVIKPPVVGGKGVVDADGMPIIWSTILGDSIRLDDAIVNAMVKMTSYDSLGNDLESLELFGEVFSSDIDATDSITREYLWYAFDHMKSTLENAFNNNQITLAQNQSEFEPHVALFVNALTLLTDSVIDEENYRTQFYHEIDKAHLFRVIGQPQIGLNILDELENCGIDSTQQAELNHWKTVFQEDLVVEEIGIVAIDTIISIDTTNYIVPELNVNQYSFGAIINSLNDIEYPNCGFYNSKALSVKEHEMKGLNVFPNPASESVTIQVNSDVDGKGILTFQLADGRKVYSKEIDIIKANQYSVDISSWNPGIYLVTLTYTDGKQITQRLIVK